MAEEEEHVGFSKFVRIIREQREGDESLSLEAAVDSVLASGNWSEVLELRHTPANYMENKVFENLVAREAIDTLSLYPTVGARCIPELLDRVQQNLEMVIMRGVPMSGDQANVIFKKLCDNELKMFALLFRGGLL